jgi:hypothetical protein
MGAAPTLPGGIGIVGGGQLAWMLAEAAQRRGVDLVVQTPNPHDPAVALASRLPVGPLGTRLGSTGLGKHGLVQALPSWPATLAEVFARSRDRRDLRPRPIRLGW